jgi:hypothetical protein
MMPMRARRKTRDMEKIENLYRTATVQKIMPTRVNKLGHACAMAMAPAPAASRWSSIARRIVKT